MTSAPPAPPRPVRSGIIFAIGAYLLWGFLPVYFLLLAPTGAFEIVGWRILFSLLFCALLVTITRSWPAMIAIVRQPRLLGTMALAAVFIYINWQVFVFGTVTGHVIETSLGYFINPIVTVLLGVIFLRERLRSLQWTAVGISAVAVLVIAINYGAFPWIALSLAFSFGFYGLIKKRVGPRVDALSGLILETAWLTPVAIVQLVIVGATAGLTFGMAGTANVLLLIGVGVATAIPLLLFAAASRRLPLVTIGFVQYLTPLLQFALGAVLLHEPITAVRWVGFALVWFALALLTFDLVRAGRSARRAAATVV
ncbi:EamA family transporter RarD [Lacisediminihabitans changchengi]|uniref:EamA family transporter RarD n=1 Tax=Lacisediminihabitans changchengi TaxID=2787634 RepID=A0A934W2X2_9MICO|nr:EamA family transporter RarD [Lacisediminihabitans changchengi]MBK4348348.1 EamA family transporter RarD [Lacisediminihabitans changchengi]